MLPVILEENTDYRYWGECNDCLIVKITHNMANNVIQRRHPRNLLQGNEENIIDSYGNI